MRLLITMITIMIMSVCIIAGCGGGDPTIPDSEKNCMTGCFGLNDKGAIIVYPGDYYVILNYRCERCHDVEHRENP